MTSFNLAYLRNKLAFSKHKWYVLLNINKVLSFDVKAFGQLGTKFKAMAAGTATLALATAPSFAQDANVYRAAANSQTSAASTSAANLPEDAAQAWQDASACSTEEPVIAYALYGSMKGYSNARLRQGFVTLFDRARVPASDLRQFSAIEENAGASVGFYVDGVSFGPFTIEQGMNEVPKIAEMYKEHKPVQAARLRNASTETACEASPHRALD